MLFTIKAILIGIVLAVVESTLLNALEIGGIKPDLAVLAVVVMTSRWGFRRGIALAFLLGLVRDFFSHGPLGMNAFALTSMAYLLAAAEDYLMTEHRAAQVFVVFVGSACFGAAFAALKLILRYETGSVTHILQLIFWTSVYTSIFAPLAFELARKTRFPSYMRLKQKYDTEHETLPETKI